MSTIDKTNRISRAFGYLLLVVGVFLVGSQSKAQTNDPKLSLTVSQKKVAKNENIELQISTSEPVSDYIEPDLKDFIILGGPQKMTSMQMTSINGRQSMQRNTSFLYIIQPKKEGILTIPPAAIVSGNKKYVSNSVKIEVTPAIASTSITNLGAPNRSAGDPKSSQSDDIRLVCSVSDHTPYIGQPVAVTYRLYYSVNFGNAQAFDIPKFDGFWTQNYTKADISNAESQDYYDNILYDVAIWHKVLLIPQKSGSFTIPSMSMRCVARIPTGRYDYWGDEIVNTVPIVVTSVPQTITVRDLPETGKPENFSGAVGQFTLDADLTKSQLRTGESASLTVRVSGSGNLNHLRLPELSFPSEIESYDPKNNTKTSLTPSGLDGSASEEFILIPRMRGNYKLPEISFSYFDPKQNRYITLKAPELSLSAEGDPIKSSSQGSLSSEKSKVDYLNDEIGFIRSKSNLIAKDKDYFYNTGVFSFLVFLPLTLIPIIIIGRIFGRRVDQNSPEALSRRSAGQARKRLSKAKKMLSQGDFTAFYSELEGSLYGFVQSKLGINAKDASIENIRRMLTERSVPQIQADDLIKVLENCNMARYAGFGQGQAEQDYQMSLSVIESINKSF